MYTSVRKYPIASDAAEEIGRRVEEGFVPIISQAPGFVAYYGLPVVSGQKAEQFERDTGITSHHDLISLQGLWFFPLFTVLLGG